MKLKRRSLQVESLESRKLLAGDVTTPLAVNIVGGQMVESDWPMVVSLSASNSHICGATLIAPDAIVTAAHCVQSDPLSSLRATIGRTDLRTNVGEVVGIHDAFVHPDFDASTFEADIAVLRLDVPSSFNSVGVVRAHQTSLTVPGTTATAFGWGAIEESLFAQPVDILKQVDLPIVSNETANSPEGHAGDVTDRMLAAGEPGKDTCSGDSGGPLFVKDADGDFLLAGITSWGDGCGMENLPGIYTRVSSFDDWLQPFLLPSPAGSVVLDASIYRVGQTATVTLRDLDLAGNGTHEVTFTSSRGDTETVTVTEISDGLFAGSVLLADEEPTPTNGILEIVPRGSLQVAYEDQDFVDGQPQSVVTTASVFGDDHGDSQLDAAPIAIGSTTTGELEESGDADWFAVELVAGQRYAFSTVLVTLEDSVLAVYNENGTEIVSNDDTENTPASKVEWEPAHDGRYYIEVAGYADAMGGYQLQVRTSDATDDHRNGPIEATHVADGNTRGSVNTSTDRDWFNFNAVAGVMYGIEVKTIGLIDSYLRLIDVDGETQLAFNDDIPNGTSSKIDWRAPSTGTYFFEVTGWSGDIGSYEIRLSSFVPQDAFEPNDVRTEASIWRPGLPTLENLSLDNVNDEDWFQWVPDDAAVYSLTLQLADETQVANVKIVDAVGATLVNSDSSTENVFVFEAPAHQPVFVQISSEQVIPRYDLSVTRGLHGDLDGDADLDIADVDTLCSAIRSSDSTEQFDLNRDGQVDELDLDFMLSDILGTVFGDVNLDGLFDSGDLVIVFGAAEYEDDIDGNSNWSSGDWNCDGNFTTNDLVTAFSHATYSRNAAPWNLNVVSVGEIWLRHGHDIRDGMRRVKSLER
ncbi:MAG: trypsin-like serine protease [Planctomycetales bacterium]|nr:trypsin-like serine protease [Planctomycetales bacterium]